jgi:hypothetical protein
MPLLTGGLTAGPAQADLFAQALLPALETARGPLCFGSQTYRIREDGGVMLLRAWQPAFLDACLVEG